MTTTLPDYGGMTTTGNSTTMERIKRDDHILPIRRGFAAMDPERHRELARLGARRAHDRGTAHRWTSAEAARAGAKGGRTPRRRKGTSKRLELLNR